MHDISHEVCFARVCSALFCCGCIISNACDYFTFVRGRLNGTLITNRVSYFSLLNWIRRLSTWRQPATAVMTVSHFMTGRYHLTSGTSNTAANDSQALWHHLATLWLWCSIVTAVSLTRASRYPTVRWRSFLRKIQIRMTVRGHPGGHLNDVTWGSYRQNHGQLGCLFNSRIWASNERNIKARHYCPLEP